MPDPTMEEGLPPEVLQQMQQLAQGQPQMPSPAGAQSPPVSQAPAQNSPGNIFNTYDPQGAMGGLFAPAFIRGFAPSEQAVMDWNQGRHLPAASIEQTAMPGLWKDPRIVGKTPYKGGDIPLNQNLTNKGLVDPQALRSASMGGTYDLEGRRDQIAARIAENDRLMSAVGYDPNNPATWVFPKKKKGHD